jgi:hypothetical protein
VTRPLGSDAHSDGWFGLPCWNGLSLGQQEQLIKRGALGVGYEPAGWCKNGAAVEITTRHDAAPGPRFYCYECLPGYAVELLRAHQERGAGD